MTPQRIEQLRDPRLARVAADCGHEFDVHAVGHTRAGSPVATCPTCGVSAAVIQTTIAPQEG